MAPHPPAACNFAAIVPSEFPQAPQDWSDNTSYKGLG